MSAYIVSRGHIRYLVEAARYSESVDPKHPGGRCEGMRSYYHGQQRHAVNEMTLSDIGLMLWQENAKSVTHRYPGEGPDSLPGPVGDGPHMGYSHRILFSGPPFNPVQVIKAVACYEYQTCEHPEWEASEAAAFCDALRKHAISCLPGYDGAEWGAPHAYELDPPVKPARPRLVVSR